MEQIIKTCTEMLDQRGYVNTGEEYKDRIVFVNKDKHKICVFTSIIVKFGVERLIEYTSAVNDMQIDHCIVIYSISVTPAVNKALTSNMVIKFELFCDNELKYNITRHDLVPKHIRISDEEATIFKKKYGVKFGTIFTSEPIARFYNYKPGEIIKILRKDGTISYRVVKHRVFKKIKKI